MTEKSRKERLEEMLVETPDDAFLHYGLAMEYVSEGNDDEAVRRFRRMFDVAPDYVAAYQQAGQALVRLGRNTEAQEVLRQGMAIAHRQGNPHAAEEMAELLGSLE